MPDTTPGSATNDPKPKDEKAPAENERDDLEEAQKEAAEEREDEGGYQ